jgi:hypothetical protein
MDSWGPDMWKAAYSMLPQSTVVDSLNQGMVKIYNDAFLCSSEEACCNIDILAQVHDSILMQIPIDIAGRSAFSGIQARVYDYVSPNITYNNRDFKIATDSKFGFNWGGASKTNPRGMREVKNNNDLRAMLNEQRT